jgi:hypothetical protein
MKHIASSLEKLKTQLLASPKEKLLCLSTTANINNPDVLFGGIRETSSTIAGNIIIRNTCYVDDIIRMFDGVVSYFLVDCEIKNEVINLESYVVARVTQSRILVYKPNDFAVDSLDMLLACLYVSLDKKKISIVGFGNIGAKISLKLCERGANVSVFERNQERMNAIVCGLNKIKNSGVDILGCHSIQDAVSGADVLLGCTPGIPVIDEELVNILAPHAIIIDVGNGTLLESGVNQARKSNREVLCLSSFAGYVSVIENWLCQRRQLSQIRYKQFDHFTLVIPGVFGMFGDILVDSIENVSHVIGICNGHGDIISVDEAKSFLYQIPETDTNRDVLRTLKQLYFIV